MWNCLGRLLGMMNQEPEDIFSELTAKIWASSEMPSLLYHYTALEGARSIIVHEKKLWASSFESMNDNRELRYGFSIAKCDIPLFLPKIFNDDSLIKDISGRWSSFLKEQEETPTLRPYILSFTESSESKLHWNQYADSSKGVALEFRHDSSLDNNAKGYWVKATYDEITAREKFRINLSKATDKLKDFYIKNPGISEEDAHSHLRNLFHTYLQIIFNFSISLKEPKWAGEQEWRLVLFKAPHVSRQLKRATGTN